jgi:hypothetical protein
MDKKSKKQELMDYIKGDNMPESGIPIEWWVTQTDKVKSRLKDWGRKIKKP